MLIPSVWLRAQSGLLRSCPRCGRGPYRTDPGRSPFLRRVLRPHGWTCSSVKIWDYAGLLWERFLQRAVTHIKHPLVWKSGLCLYDKDVFTNGCHGYQQRARLSFSVNWCLHLTFTFKQLLKLLLICRLLARCSSFLLLMNCSVKFWKDFLQILMLSSSSSSSLYWSRRHSDGSRLFLNRSSSVSMNSVISFLRNCNRMKSQVNFISQQDQTDW